MCCSARDTENHSLTKRMPDRVSISSNRGAWRRNSRYSTSVRTPTPLDDGPLYQDRSNRTISRRRRSGRCSAGSTTGCPPALGFSRATIRAPRGLRCSMNRLMVPPLPAASRPRRRRRAGAQSAHTAASASRSGEAASHARSPHGPSGRCTGSPAARCRPPTVRTQQHRVVIVVVDHPEPARRQQRRPTAVETAKVHAPILPRRGASTQVCEGGREVWIWRPRSHASRP